MVEDLPDTGRRVLARQRVETARRLANGVHVTGADDDAIELVSAVVASTPELHYVSQFTYAAPDYTLNTLPEADRVREASIARLSRSLADNMVRLDDELSGARTGRLIRIFLVADGGAAYCTEVSAGRHLSAVSLLEPGPDGSPPFDTARRVDGVTAGLTNQLRRHLGQRPLDYGGWLARAEAGDAPAAVDCSAGGEPVPPRVEARDSRVAEVCLAHVDCRRLHYVAVYRQGEEIASVDVMHHPELARFLYGDQTVDDRRRFYAHFGVRIGRYLNDLTLSAEPAIGPSVRHVALDVERGAVFFHRLDPSTYLVGVSLDQDEIASAEQQIAELARDLGT